MSRSKASLLSLLGGIAVFVAVVLLAVIPFARELGSVVDAAKEGVAELAQKADEEGLVSAEQADEVRAKVRVEVCGLGESSGGSWAGSS